jgi:peptide/nickel transport system substrate-binding protein
MLVDQSPTTAVYERNPYYFKVDSAGQQLPYIDGLRSQVVADVEMSNLKVLAGEVDFLREDATLDKLDLYKENEDRAGYEVVLLDMHVTPTDPRLNLTYDDPVWRQVVNDVRFRKALSHAINRAEIIDAIYFGFATPSTFVPATYDPDLANRLLDEAGLDQRDAQGFRLGPDGKTFEIPFEIAMHASDQVPVTEMVMEYWKDVGIKTTMKTIEPGLQATRRNANELQADLLWHHGPELWWGALWDFVPSAFGRAWFTWFNTAGAEGEEPPDVIKEGVALRQLLATQADMNDRIATMKKITDLHADNLWAIGIVGGVNTIITTYSMANVPGDDPENCWHCGEFGRPEVWFRDE